MARTPYRAADTDCVHKIQQREDDGEHRVLPIGQAEREQQQRRGDAVAPPARAVGGAQQEEEVERQERRAHQVVFFGGRVVLHHEGVRVAVHDRATERGQWAIRQIAQEQIREEGAARDREQDFEVHRRDGADQRPEGQRDQTTERIQGMKSQTHAGRVLDHGGIERIACANAGARCGASNRSRDSRSRCTCRR